MACITSPAITEDLLLAFIDGTATVEIVAHVQQCADCQARAQQLAHQQNRLAAQLYRAACPSSLELGEYHLDLLPAARAVSIELHLATCLHCAREIQTLQSYLADLDATFAFVPQIAPMGPSLGSPFKRFVAKLVKASAVAGMGNGMSPALAGLRGDQADQFVYEANDVQIILEVQAEPDHPGYKILLGLVLGLDVTQTFEVRLGQVGQMPITAPVDELGNFVFEHLSPGNYTLFLRSATSEIQVEEIKM